MVDRAAGVVISTPSAATAEQLGNIIAGNRAGLVGDGSISGTCNNPQLGTEPVLVDSRFVSTPGRRYRLAADSPMISLGLRCKFGNLPDDYEFPQFDLDGNLGVGDGEAHSSSRSMIWIGYSPTD